MTPNALAAAKLTAILVGLAIGLFGAFVFTVLGPREREAEDEGSAFLDWCIDVAWEGWSVTTAWLAKAWSSRVGDWVATGLFFLANVFVFFPVGLYVRAVSALRRAVRA